MADVPAPEGSSDEAVEVWDEHWDSYAVFRACTTQWKVANLQVGNVSTLVRIGLDYPGVEAVMRHLLPETSDRPRVFCDVLVMEAEALPILNEASA